MSADESYTSGVRYGLSIAAGIVAEELEKQAPYGDIAAMELLEGVLDAIDQARQGVIL